VIVGWFPMPDDSFRNISGPLVGLRSQQKSPSSTASLFWMKIEAGRALIELEIGGFAH
jgi:hypothetical protein